MQSSIKTAKRENMKTWTIEIERSGKVFASFVCVGDVRDGSTRREWPTHEAAVRWFVDSYARQYRQIDFRSTPNGFLGKEI